MYMHHNQMKVGQSVRLINLTDHVVNNIMWLDLEAHASIGVSWTDWLILQSNEGVEALLNNNIIAVETQDPSEQVGCAV